MSKYVDGFVLVVPKDKKEEYKKMAAFGRDSWMKHGALEYFETRSDDLTQQDMGGVMSRSFTDIAGATENDDVWFSFIVFKSREHRDEVNAKVYAEMDDMSEEMKQIAMSFDMSKMAYGGFQAEVEG